MRAKIAPYIYVAPFFIFFGVFSFFPFLFSFIISFTDYNGISATSFVGFANYFRAIFVDTTFRVSVFNTLFFLVIAVPIQILLALLLASLIKDFFPKTTGAFQLINFLPYLTASVAIGLLFQFIFDWKNGSVNHLLQAAGLIKNPINWLGTVWPSRWVIIILVVWKTYGYSLVILSAGLSTINNDLYEAADIDGASWMKKFTKITIPELKPIFTFLVLISLINGFQLFDDPYMLYNSIGTEPFGGPGNSILTVMMNMYQAAFRNFQLGYGAAVAYLLFVVIFIFAFLSNRLMNSEEA